MKMIILIGLLLSVITVAPKSIQQKAEGNAETLDQGPAEIKNREGPATLESRNENGEEQVQKRQKLQKILRTRQSQAKENEQEAFKKAMIEELVRAAIEAADPESHTSRQDWPSWNDMKSKAKSIAKSIASGAKSGFSKAKSFVSSGFSKAKSIASTAMDMSRKLKPIAKRLLNKYLHDEASYPSGKKVNECFENKGITETIEMVQALWITVCKKLPFPIDCEDQDRRSRDQEIQQSQAKENEQKAFRKALEVLIRSEREAADSQTNATRQDLLFGLLDGVVEKKEAVKNSLIDGYNCIKDHAKLGEIVPMIIDEAKESLELGALLGELGELEEVAEE